MTETITDEDQKPMMMISTSVAVVEEDSQDGSSSVPSALTLTWRSFAVESRSLRIPMLNSRPIDSKKSCYSIDI